MQHELEQAVEWAEGGRWIGSRPGAWRIAAFLVVGSVGLIIAGVQPVILGALVNEHRLSASALGWTTTVEFVTVGAGVSLAGMLFKPEHIRLRTICAALLALIADLAVRHQSGWAIFADRGLAGLFEGGLIWAAMLMISRSPTPARWAGIFLVAQGLAQLSFAAIVPSTLMKPFGADGGFYALALTGIVAAFAALALPDRMQPLEDAKASGQPSPIPAPAYASLVGVALIYAFFIGLFAYLTQLGTQARLNEAQSGFAVAIAVGVSVLGSGAAAILAKRLSYFVVFLVCLPVNLAALAIFAQLPGAPLFLGASAVFGFFWGFFMPFQMPFVIESDPSRRAVLLVPGIQAIGAAAGPLICSFFVSDSEARGALAVCAACILAAFAIALSLHALRIARGRSATA